MAAVGTRLADADHRFIDVLVPGHADEVLEVFTRRSAHFTMMTGGVRPSTAFRDLALWCRLVARIIAAPLSQRGPVADAICCEFETGVEEARTALFDRFLPGGKIVYVSAVTRPTTACWRGETVALLARLLRFLLSVNRSDPSELGSRYVHIAEFCLVAVSQARSARTGEAYIMRAWHALTPVLSVFLRMRGVSTSVLAATTGRLTRYETVLPADKLLLTHPYQIYSALQMPPPRGIGSLELWGPIHLPEMEKAYAGERKVPPPGTVGVYTQGFWLRGKIGSTLPETAMRRTALESELMAILAEWLDSHPEGRVIHFPHPMERRHYAKTGETGGWPIEKHPRFESQMESGARSIDSFECAAVGITTLSSVAFDRLYMGFRTLGYLGGVESFDPNVRSPFHALYCSSKGELLEQLEAILDMTDDQFNAIHFGGPLYSWRPPRILADAMRDFRESEPDAIDWDALT